MKDLQISESEKRALAIATVIAILFGAYFLSSYFYMFVIAGVLAYLFHPIYRRLLKRFKPMTASGFTLLSSLLAIIIPVTLVFLIAGLQLRSTVTSISETVSTTDLSATYSDLIEFINRTLNSLPFINVTVTQESIEATLAGFLKTVADNAIQLITSLAGSVGSFVALSIIYVYVFLSILRNGDILIRIAKKLNPLGDSISDLYIKKIAAMVRGTVQGQFIIAVVQGFLSAVVFALVGYPQFFFVLFVLFTLLSIIPLGAGIVTIPLGFLMMFTGNISGGVIVVLQHLLVTTNVDNILRPKLVPKEARLDSALMLLSVFAGIRFFGFLGIIIGPTIMVLIVTTVKVYLSVFENYTVEQKVLAETGNKKRRRFFRR